MAFGGEFAARSIPVDVADTLFLENLLNNVNMVGLNARLGHGGNEIKGLTKNLNQKNNKIKNEKKTRKKTRKKGTT